MESIPGKRREDLRILIVEDDPDTGDALCLYLKHLGAVPLQAQDGRQALDMLSSMQPDLVLCDLYTPGMDGIEFVEHVRGNPRLAHLVVIAVTGKGSSGDHERAQAHGFDACLLKPVDWDQIVDAYHSVRASR